MTLTLPLASVFPGARSSVLRALVGPDRAFTGRDVQRIAHPTASLKAVQTALNALVAEGVVLREHVGRAHQYRFNYDHVVAPGIVTILDAREELFRRIGDFVAEWSSGPEAVWLFGSVATFTETTESDIDLLVIRPDAVDAESANWESQLREMNAKVAMWSGMRCEVLELSSTETRKAMRAGEPVLQDVSKHHHVLWGQSPHEWFSKPREITDGPTSTEPSR